MATPYSVSEIIEIAEVCQPLALTNLLRKNNLKKGVINWQQPLLIFLVRRTVQYNYDTNPLSLNTDTNANYLYALCQPYIGRALILLGQGGGGIIIDPGTGQPINLSWVTYSFTVGQSGSLIDAGDSAFTVSLSNILYDSVAFGFSNSSPMPRTGTVPSGGFTYAVVYSQPSITITLSYPVEDGQQFTLSFGRAVASSSSGGGGGGGTALPTPYLIGKYLTNDGTNLAWQDIAYEITSEDFEPDGVTYINTVLATHTYFIYLQELNRDLYDSEFTVILSGGFTITMDGFNANTNDYSLKINIKGG